jgi:hypothetical protein
LEKVKCDKDFVLLENEEYVFASKPQVGKEVNLTVLAKLPEFYKPVKIIMENPCIFVGKHKENIFVFMKEEG